MPGFLNKISGIHPKPIFYKIAKELIKRSNETAVQITLQEKEGYYVIITPNQKKKLPLTSTDQNQHYNIVTEELKQTIRASLEPIVGLTNTNKVCGRD